MTLTWLLRKWACLHVMVAFASSPVVTRLRALSIIFVPTRTRNCLGVGHGGDNQQQHILIVASSSLKSGGLLPQIWGKGWLQPSIPSSSNNWPRGCICRMSSLQNWALMLKTWTPESMKAVTSCPSIITGASLEHPTKTCYGVWIEEWYWADLVLSSFPFCCLHMGQFWIGVREGMLWVYWLHDVGGWPHSLGSPQSLFNSFAGVAHSLAIWPQPWHLKHSRVLKSFAFWALPWAPVECLGTPPTLGSSGYPTCNRRAASSGVLAQASTTFMGAGANRSIPVCLPSLMIPVPGTIWSTSRASALFSSV